MTKRSLAAALALSFGLTLSARGEAQTSAADKAAAEALFDQAQALMKKKDFAEACTKFEQSQRIDPAIGTLLYLADCYERVGKLASAWATFREGASEAREAGQMDRARAGEKRAALLEPRLSKLTVVVAKDNDGIDGLTITRGKEDVLKGLWGVAVPVDAGQYTVRASAPGYKPFETTVTVAANAATESVDIPKLEADPSQAAPPEEPPPPAEPPPAPIPVTPPPATPGPDQGTRDEDPGASQRTIGLVVGGVGLVGIGVGTFFGLDAISKNDDAKSHCPRGTVCDDQEGVSLTDDAKKAATVSNIAFAVGGAALVGGVVLFLTAPSKSDTAIRVAPAVGPRQASVLVGGRF
ncbi:MAG: tetratricopeptide repeat protein [Polyangiaceae bacterium]|nr:tetratricopeptide repeat protein [Polyangiaceae bacterium]